MPPNIVVYYRPFCPWARQVLSFFDERKIAFTGKNLSEDLDSLKEMINRTGQEISPCVEIDGHMLVDVGREEIETYMLAKGLIGKKENAG